MFRIIGAAAAALAVFGLTACSDSSDEPAGLAGNTTPATTGTEAPSETPPPTEEAPADETETEPEPTPVNTFTQPYLPEERVVEVRDAIPVEPPDDATDEELAVLDAFSHAEGAWEQILWGVPPEDTDLVEYSTGKHLTSTRDYAQESVERKRVSIGEPQQLELLGIEVQEAEATVRFCADTSTWSDYTVGGAPQPDDRMYHGTATLEHTEEAWKVNEYTYSDDLSPCEEVF